MKENDNDFDDISFTTEENVVGNMKEEEFSSEQKKYSLILVINVDIRALVTETLRGTY